MTLMTDAGPGFGTGDALCAYRYGLLDEDEYEQSRHRTDVVIAWITDPVLRDALEKFSDVIAPLAYWLHDCQVPVTFSAGQSWYADINLLARRPMTIWTGLDLVSELGQQVHRLPQAVQAVADIQNMLGLSLKQVLKAARISPRTYHSWRRNPQRRPRLESQGRLWRLHQLTEDLVETMSEAGVRRWFAADGSRLSALLRGRFDDLAALASPSSGTSQGLEQNFEGALDERESRPRLPRYPITGRKMNPDDVVGSDK